MKNETLYQLLKSIHKYYPIGQPHFDGWSAEMKKIIGDKVDGKGDVINRWKNFIVDLRIKKSSFIIHDLSFLQFPNLMLVVEHTEKVDKITVCKNFVVCLSLLCPFYTYHYEYTHKIRIGERSIKFNEYVFLSELKFTDLKISITEKEIRETLFTFFPDYVYLSHYELMMNKVIGGFPHGIDSTYNDNLEYSFYQFLFNNEQSDSVFQ